MPASPSRGFACLRRLVASPRPWRGRRGRDADVIWERTMRPCSRARIRCLALSLALAGCASGPVEPVTLPPLTAAPLTTERTIQLVHPRAPRPELKPAEPAALEQLLGLGLGDTVDGPPMPVTAHTLDGAPAPASSASPKLLVRFVHLPDAQLIDDESPARVVDFDTMDASSGAYRPQEAWSCRVLNAAVRAINKLHETTPIELTLLGGDNA